MVEYIAVAGVAQLVEQLIRNQQITGSSPVTSSISDLSRQVAFLFLEEAVMDLCNVSVIKEVMGEAGISFRKEFGQNFLINRIIPEEIADNAAYSDDTLIIEIGPGIGCLTKELAERYKRVVAVEIDKGLIPVLAKTLADYDNVTVINADIMKTDIADIIANYSDGMPVAVCANLPYYITTPILMYLLESGVNLTSITVMVQNEVAARLVAKAGSADYGAITAVLGFYGEARKLFKVSAGSFMPAPKVDSAVVKIELYKEPRYFPKDEKFFRNLIKAAFEMRRKTLVNAINAKFSHIEKSRIAECLASLGFAETVRGERLSTDDFVKLSNLLV